MSNHANEAIFGILSTTPITGAQSWSAVEDGGKVPRGIWVRAPGTLAVSYRDGTSDTFTAADFVAGGIYPMPGLLAITGTPTLTGKIIY